MTSSPASDWSIAFLGELVLRGLRHIVVSPGSRSQALALVAMAFASRPESTLEVHVVVDERSAGFFALGLASHTHTPVALLCTSGSAPAHYLPSLLEAHHSGVGMIAITADRPEELLGVGANQTTTQPGLFGPAVRAVFDVEAPEGGVEEAERARQVAQMAWDTSFGVDHRPGPVQVNVGFREPLSASLVSFADPATGTGGSTAEDGQVALPPWTADRLNDPRVVELAPEPGTVVVAGHGAGPKAEELARALHAPLIAEVHSGAHFGPHLVVAYRKLLSEPELSSQITRVVTVGRPTLSREVWALVGRTDIQQIVWQKTEPEPANPTHSAVIADRVVATVPSSDGDAPSWAKAWVGSWVMASRAILEEESAVHDAPPPEWENSASKDMAKRSGFARDELEIFRRKITRRSLALAVWEATWPHDRLVLASSRMIRVLDAVAPGKNIPVWSSRGLAGIDGQVATARGVARANPGGGTTRLLVGDVAFLHDAGSLLLDKGEADTTRLHVIVARDGGGSIFDQLEAKASSEASHFDRVMFTPVSADFSALATAYGWEYLKVTQLGELPEAMASSAKHLIVEVSLDRVEPDVSSDF